MIKYWRTRDKAIGQQTPTRPFAPYRGSFVLFLLTFFAPPPSPFLPESAPLRGPSISLTGPASEDPPRLIQSRSPWNTPHGLPASAVVFRVILLRLDGHVGEGDAVFRDDESHVEGGFGRRLVPTRKSPSGVGGLELSASQDSLLTVRSFVIAAVETLGGNWGIEAGSGTGKQTDCCWKLHKMRIIPGDH